MGLLILFSPLPLASVDYWAILTMQICVLALMGIYLTMKKKPEINPHLSALIKKIRIPLIAFFVYMVIQCLPFPKFLSHLFSPGTLQFHHSFSFEPIRLKLMSISLAPFHSFREASELLTYFLAGFLVIKTVTTKNHLKKIIYLLVGMGVFQSLYGMFELTRSNPHVLFYKKTINLNMLTGTFINQNHIVGYLAMIFPLAVGLIVARINPYILPERNWREKFIHLTNRKGLSHIFLVAAVFVICFGIFLSRSRMGLFLLLFSFIIFSQLSISYYGGVRRAQTLLKKYVRIFFVLVTVVILFFGVDATLDRFALENLAQEGRPQYWANMTRMIGDFPLFGTGLGTFAYVYPAYEKGQIHAFLVHAHNDYLEYLSELGIIGMAFMMFVIFYMAIKFFKVWKKRRNPFLKGVGMGGLVSLLLIGTHSFTDFNLHIPANMLLFSLVFSLTTVARYLGWEGPQKSLEPGNNGESENKVPGDSLLMAVDGNPGNKKRSFSKRHGRVIGLISLTILGAVNILTYTNIHLHLKAKRKIGNLNQKIQMLDKSNSIAPFNDGVFHDLGKAYFQLGMNNIGRPQQRDDFLFQSLKNLKTSVRLNPGYYQTHFHLAQTMMYLNYFSDGDYDYFAEFKKAARLNNFDQEAYFEVGRILLSKWPELSSEDQTFCLQILRKITEEAEIEDLRSIIQIWAAVVRDYRVMNMLLPEKSHIYRMYADLLGEVSLSVKERQLKMTEAEGLEFMEAVEANEEGQTALRFFRLYRAEDLFSSGLDKLENIRFYQRLSGRNVIDPKKFFTLKKSLMLGLLKSRVELKKSFSEIKDLFCAYIDKEDSQEKIKDLENFLVYNNYLDRSQMPSFKDMDQILCRLTIDFARHRYQDIIRFGENLKTKLLMMDNKSTEEFARIYEILGDSYNKLDYIFDTGNFYEKAIEIVPNDADLLIKLQAYYDWLNRSQQVKNIQERLNNLLTSSEIDISNPHIIKGQLYTFPIRIEQDEVDITLELAEDGDLDRPLVSVFLNGCVCWEDYVEDGHHTITLRPNFGDNLMQIRSVNKHIQLVRVGCISRSVGLSQEPFLDPPQPQD